MAGFRLRLYRAAKIHRGEERRTVGFALIYLMISMITGLLSSGGDVLFLQHPITWAELKAVSLIQGLQEGLAGAQAASAAEIPNINTVLVAPLLGLGALLLIGLGIFYTGWTDRRDKRHIFLGGMAVTVLLSLVLAAGLGFPVLQRFFPYFYSFIYILRFSGGVLLLMIFWDLTGHYFDVRQGKRLYPLMAAAGVAGYTLGTLLVSPFLIYLNPAVLFLAIGFLAAASYAVFRHLNRRVRPLWISRTRAENFLETLFRGAEFFRQNRFLRVLSLSTLLFGVAAGLIMFTYNGLVTELTETSRGTAHLIALQRAAASILQAVIVTKVLSQSAMGGQLRSHFVMQVAVLFLGFVAFLISMVGVADFTRQIAIALMSPAAMAAFAIIPAEYRGRSMAVINLVVAPAGMVLASLAAFVLESFFALGIFVGLIAFFLIARLVMNLWVSRAYLDTLTAGAEKTGDFDAASLFEEAGSLLQDEKTLSIWMEKLESQEEPVKLLLWGRIAEQVNTKGEYLRLKPYAPPLKGRRGALWLRLMSRFDRAGVREELVPLEALDGELRREGLRIVRETFPESDPLHRQYRQHRRELLQGLEENRLEGLQGIFGEILSLELERGDAAAVQAAVRGGQDILDGAEVSQGGFLLEEILKNPQASFQGIYYRLAEDPKRRPAALTALEAVPSFDISSWEQAYRRAGSTDLRLSLQDLLASQLTPDKISWFWGFLTEELDRCFGEDSFFAVLANQDCFALINGLYRIALGLQEEFPQRLRTRSRQFEEQLVRYKGEILSMESQPFPQGIPYQALYRRWLAQFDQRLMQTLLAVTGLRLRDSEQRHRYSLLIRDFHPGVASARTKVLELLDTVLDKREQTAFSLFLEPLTREEQLVRLRSVLRQPESSWKGFFDYWKRDRLPDAEQLGGWKRRLLQSALAAVTPEPSG